MPLDLFYSYTHWFFSTANTSILLVITLYFPLDALNVSDSVSPSSGATFISCTSHLVYADTSSCCVAIATQQLDVWYRYIPAYTKCDVQLIKVAPDDGLI